jgi:hypothetical protein
MPLFDANIPPANVEPVPAINDGHHVPAAVDHVPAAIDQIDHQQVIPDTSVIPGEPRRSARVPQHSEAGLQSKEYKQRETTGKDEGQDWATNRSHPKASSAIDWSSSEHEDVIACLAETKASHHIPRSYRHAITTDPDRWMLPMRAEIETLKAKHTWDLVKPPPGVNIMDSMWVYNIKWDGEGNRIKDKARLVGKGYIYIFNNLGWIITRPHVIVKILQ